MKPPIIKCTQCNGCGETVLPGHLLATLAAFVTPTRAPSTIPDIHRRLAHEDRRLKVTAVNNRVRELERLGFVRKVGKRDKAHLWKLT